MKKILLGALLASFVAVNAEEVAQNSMTGFTVSAGAGVELSGKSKFKDSDPTDGDSVDSIKHKKGALFNLAAGYGMQVNSLYFGAEIYLLKSLAKYKVNGRVDGVAISANLKNKITYGLEGIFGVALDKTLLYVGLGLERSHKAIKIESLSISEKVFGFVPSAGVRYFINSNLFVGAKVSYAISSKIKTREVRTVASVGYKF